MEFKNTEIFNFEGAFRGMRNPLESWKKSDSIFCEHKQVNQADYYRIAKGWIAYENTKREKENKSLIEPGTEEWYEIEDKCIEKLINSNGILLGPNDVGLAQRLLRGGNEHAKFMRQIFVSVDITAPLYWWKEFDTYKIGTTANSTSTMHKLMSKPFTFDMFSFDLENEDIEVSKTKIDETNGELINLILTLEDFYFDIIENCNILRKKYLETKDLAYWRALVQILPNAFNQTRTWTANYAVLRTMYFQRRNHKLKEWHEFCNWIATLPYSEELIMLED